jgi:catechol 2,3-dioxygenase-like lactoylglutathione lyase family enzyme
MSYRLGQLIDHIGIRVSDYAAARRFYLALFKALDLGDQVGEGPQGLDLDELYIGPAWQGGPVTRGLHLCLQAKDREMVARAHAAGMEAGGHDNGAPGLRDYHPGYFAAFLLDLDGNNIEVKSDERIIERTTAFVEVSTR